MSAPGPPRPCSVRLRCNVGAGSPESQSRLLPVAAGVGDGYWFSGLQPFPFTC